jgi:ribose 5-phosphate isomerase B
MRIAVGADHGGVDLKDHLVAHLLGRGVDVVDLGAHDRSSVDYPDYAVLVCGAVLSGEADAGLLICGTGQGMAMTANRIPGIRAAVVADVFSARMARAHNDAQVLCLGARVLGVGLAIACLDGWLDASFEGGRHQGRLDKMAAAPGAVAELAAAGADAEQE